MQQADVGPAHRHCSVQAKEQGCWLLLHSRYLTSSTFVTLNSKHAICIYRLI